MAKSRSKSRAKTKAGAQGQGGAEGRASRGRAGVVKGGKAARKPSSQASGTAPNPAAEIRRLTAELARARGRIRELETLSETDPLLEILNRRGFERALKSALAYLKRYRGTGALIALDVDRLKVVNDKHGHAAGDALLKNIVDYLSRQIRASDVIGRLGGDEFAILLWNLSEADAFAKAASLEAGIDGLITVFRGKPLAAGASTGVAFVRPDDDVATILERADSAMYARKTERRPRGKNS